MCLFRKKFEIKIFVVVVIVYISVSLEMCNFFRIRFLFGFRFQSRLFFSKLSCYVSENCEKSSMRVMKPEEATRLSGWERPQFLLVLPDFWWCRFGMHGWWRRRFSDLRLLCFCSLPALQNLKILTSTYFSGSSAPISRKKN